MGKLPTFDKCCFCAQLQTGAVILGSLGVLNSVTLILFSIAGIFLTDDVVEKISSERVDITDPVKVKAVFLSLLVASILLNLIVLVSSCCLLTGAIKVSKYGKIYYYNAILWTWPVDVQCHYYKIIYPYSRIVKWNFLWAFFIKPFLTLEKLSKFSGVKVSILRKVETGRKK